MTSNYIQNELLEDMLKYISFDKLIEMKIALSDDKERALIGVEEMLFNQTFKNVFRIFKNRFPVLNKVYDNIYLTIIVVTSNGTRNIDNLRYRHTSRSNTPEKIILIFSSEDDCKYSLYHEIHYGDEIVFYLNSAYTGVCSVISIQESK